MIKLKRPWKYVLAALLVAAGIFCFKRLGDWCDQQTDGFSEQVIAMPLAVSTKWDVRPLSVSEIAEVKAALDQPYDYLARGQQAFVFLSRNGKYVVKFFNRKSSMLPFPWNFLPEKWLFNQRKACKLQRRKDKLHRDFMSYKLSFDQLQTETGLLFVHLSASNNLGARLHFQDKLRIEHALDLDQVPFVVQRCAQLVYPHIEQLMAAQRESEAKQALSSLLALFVKRCQLGIADSDPDLDKNFGFIGNQAVQIDTGRFVAAGAPLPPKVSPVGPPLIKASFKEWLSQYPALFEHFEEEYQRLKATGSFSTL